MHAVGEVDVDVPGRAEHHRVARACGRGRRASRVAPRRRTPRPRSAGPRPAPARAAVLDDGGRAGRGATSSTGRSKKPRRVQSAGQRCSPVAHGRVLVRGVGAARRAARPTRAGAVPPYAERATPARRGPRAPSRTSGVRCGDDRGQVVVGDLPQLDSRARRTSRTSRPAISCASRNGDAACGPATRRRRWPARSPSAPPRPCARSSDLQRGDHPGHRGQHEQQLVDGVEDRLLVLLQVAVVGERQALERRPAAPVRLPISRPDLPRASSATSGFFFCGMIDDPVA